MEVTCKEGNSEIIQKGFQTLRKILESSEGNPRIQIKIQKKIHINQKKISMKSDLQNAY